MTHKLWIAAGVLVVAALAWVNWASGGPETDETRHKRDAAQRVVAGKQALFARALTEKSKVPFDSSMAERQLAVLEELEREPEDRADRAVLTGELFDSAAARKVLDSVPDGLPLLRRLYGDGELTDEERADLADRGWFGRLASVHGLADDDPRRAELLDSSRGSATVLFWLTSLALVAFAGGFALFIMTLVRLRRGELRARFRLHDQGSGDLVWLQTAVLGLAGVLALSIGLLRHIGLPTSILTGLLCLPMFWPLLRGVSAAEWRGALGLLRGEGVVREMVAGVTGYLAGLPLIALGFWVSIKLIAITGWDPSHPVQESVTDPNAPVWGILLAACVWAPLIEETIFRGALYRYLRPSLSLVGSSVLTGAIFAFVHPQGLALLPALGAVGIVLGLLREWRGSLIGCMTAHALHNGVLLAAALAALR